MDHLGFYPAREINQMDNGEEKEDVEKCSVAADDVEVGSKFRAQFFKILFFIEI